MKVFYIVVSYNSNGVHDNRILDVQETKVFTTPSYAMSYFRDKLFPISGDGYYPTLRDRTDWVDHENALITGDISPIFSMFGEDEKTCVFVVSSGYNSKIDSDVRPGVFRDIKNIVKSVKRNKNLDELLNVETT